MNLPRTSHLGPALVLSTLSAVVAADFEAGVAAYKQGDYMKAAVEFLIDAEKGNTLAQLNLGLLYDEGRGVEQDFLVAVRWYRLAAENGNELAQLNLGSMYFQGLGVDQDYASAAGWYRRAALAGNVHAQYNLAVMHEEGAGIAKDPIQAYAWLEIAAANDGDVPQEERAALAEKLSDEELSQAHELIDIYLKDHNKESGAD